MSYFSRLTEIVTCNLSTLLDQAEDPKTAIAEIIAEMEEGLTGARRSVKTATANADRLGEEISGNRQQMENWSQKAKQALQEGREADARSALIRRREAGDLVAGLDQQHAAAVATRDHLLTLQRALEARLADAIRKRALLENGQPHNAPLSAIPLQEPATMHQDRVSELDAEMEALRRELGV